MDFIESLLAALAYVGVGVGLLILNFYALDLLTPGRLVTHIFGEVRSAVRVGQHVGIETGGQPGSYSAALLAAAAAIGQGLIAFTTIWVNADASFGAALGWTIGFGLFGVAISAVAFLLIDFLTPGKLGDVVCQPGPIRAPAVVAAAMYLAVAGIVVASIA